MLTDIATGPRSKINPTTFEQYWINNHRVVLVGIKCRGSSAENVTADDRCSKGAKKKRKNGDRDSRKDRSVRVREGGRKIWSNRRIKATSSRWLVWPLANGSLTPVHKSHPPRGTNWEIVTSTKRCSYTLSLPPRSGGGVLGDRKRVESCLVCIKPAKSRG
ncbi:hypothetical protein V1478_008811 [Vespula squamosa]|uniref:Uncharacterized protein n=1 Tax=Vespula squamosa TaxID=30214 RepID=A0ABD2AUM6_VESSQ